LEKFGKSLGYKMVEVVKSYEMVRTFNNFKASVTFAVKKPEALLILNTLILILKIFFDYISPENFFDPPPSSTTFPGKFFTTWSKS
jgi:hypothetical protein